MELGEAELAGLSDSFIAAAKAAAEERGMAGKAIVTLSRSSVEPFLKSSARRDLREKVFKAFIARGDNGDANDNNATIVRDGQAARGERGLLGYPTFADYRLEDAMAKTPEAVRGLLERVWKPARGPGAGRSRRPAGAGRGGGRQFRAGAVGLALLRRKAAAAQRQFRRRRHQALSRARPHDRGGLRLRAPGCSASASPPRSDIPVWHPDVRVWEVRDSAGRHKALFYRRLLRPALEAVAAPG